MSRAWSTCPEPIKLEVARGSAASVLVASDAGPVSLSAALVLRKIFGDTHAAALLKTLEGSSKPENSIRSMLTKRAREVEKLNLRKFTAETVETALRGHWDTSIKSIVVRAKGEKRPVSELGDAEQAALPGT